MHCQWKQGLSDSMKLIAPFLYFFNLVFLQITIYRRFFQNPSQFPVFLRAVVRRTPTDSFVPSELLSFILRELKGLEGRRKRLFLPLLGVKEISAASISRWISCTIKLNTRIFLLAIFNFCGFVRMKLELCQLVGHSLIIFHLKTLFVQQCGSQNQLFPLSICALCPRSQKIFTLWAHWCRFSELSANSSIITTIKYAAD